MRDLGCAITGEKALAASRDKWSGFEAAHIFPLAHEGDWNKQGLSRWITIVPERGGTINSIQNGMLLENGVHSRFDQYEISINPDVCIWVLYFL